MFDKFYFSFQLIPIIKFIDKKIKKLLLNYKENVIMFIVADYATV